MKNNQNTNKQHGFWMLNRHMKEKLLLCNKNFKGILLCGARQTGKTTLLSEFFPDHQLITFDQNQDIYGARKDPDFFLNNFPAPLILDEIQFAPELLPALKRHMDKSSAMGQYILTGSQNVLMMKTVSESLAGRIAILDLFPLTYFELYNQPSWLPAYLGQEMRQIKSAPLKAPVSELIWRGGLPGIYQKDNSVVPIYHNSYVNTYVERDVRLTENIPDISEFNRFIRLLAAITSQEINDSQLGRELEIGPVTARHWRNLLVQNYQWSENFSYFNNTIKRFSKKSKGYFVDSGLACTMLNIISPSALMASHHLGALFETYCVNNIKAWLSVYANISHVYHWRSSNQAEVDLIIDSDGFLFPIEIKCKTQVSRKDASGLNAFRKAHAHKRLAPSVILYVGDYLLQIDDHTWAVPLGSTV